MQIFLLTAAAVIFSLGGLCMKWSEGLTRLWPSIGVLATFSVGAACQALAMRHASMASTYVFVLGLEAVTAFLLGSLFLGERITAAKFAALVLIIGGLALLRRPA